MCLHSALSLPASPLHTGRTPNLFATVRALADAVVLQFSGSTNNSSSSGSSSSGQCRDDLRTARALAAAVQPYTSALPWEPIAAKLKSLLSDVCSDVSNDVIRGASHHTAVYALTHMLAQWTSSSSSSNSSSSSSSCSSNGGAITSAELATDALPPLALLLQAVATTVAQRLPVPTATEAALQPPLWLSVVRQLSSSSTLVLDSSCSYEGAAAVSDRLLVIAAAAGAWLVSVHAMCAAERKQWRDWYAQNFKLLTLVKKTQHDAQQQQQQQQQQVSNTDVSKVLVLSASSTTAGDGSVQQCDEVCSSCCSALLASAWGLSADSGSASSSSGSSKTSSSSALLQLPPLALPRFAEWIRHGAGTPTATTTAAAAAAAVDYEAHNERVVWRQQQQRLLQLYVVAEFGHNWQALLAQWCTIVCCSSSDALSSEVLSTLPLLLEALATYSTTVKYKLRTDCSDCAELDSSAKQDSLWLLRALAQAAPPLHEHALTAVLRCLPEGVLCGSHCIAQLAATAATTRVAHVESVVKLTAELVAAGCAWLSSAVMLEVVCSVAHCYEQLGCTAAMTGKHSVCSSIVHKYLSIACLLSAVMVSLHVLHMQDV
jgi:hypothetical protein